MGVPPSEVGYTSATTRREDHEVHDGHVVALGNNILKLVYMHSELLTFWPTIFRDIKYNGYI
jgi:hypothetical protein